MIIKTIQGETKMRLKTFTIIGLILGMIVLAGCSSNENKESSGDKNFQPRQKGDFKESSNFTDQQKEEMMQDGEETAKQSCENKQEGDKCIIEGRTGQIESTCEYQNDVLLCKMNRPMR